MEYGFGVFKLSIRRVPTWITLIFYFLSINWNLQFSQTNASIEKNTIVNQVNFSEQIKNKEVLMNNKNTIVYNKTMNKKVDVKLQVGDGAK